ncbi:hypothetical protein [Aestuariicoccus sp. MJ-SS9]|uniref:hypothetical protein n=1 Tax=Aestuariicoccus sp. MJ-SS9 TaxID=3079855 RepID=UPI002906506F|nr:hypothetical protein [Aestuariicoccus sp. MJ-SS9]MDU8912122.1 hypothetical protein [Aestuariicoccus sp. MJ-SS9]
MSIAAILTALSISLSPQTPAQTGSLWQAQARPPAPGMVSSQGTAPSALERDYYTTPQNCTYRRTKALGYPEMWILVLNPHHIGRPNSPTSCKGML